MIIEIPDDYSPKKRKQLLRFLPIIYALEKFNNNKSAAAHFLGMTRRSIISLISKNPTTMKIYKKVFYKKIPDSPKLKRLGDDDKINKDFPNRQIFEAHLKRMKRSFDFKQLKEKDQVIAIKRLKSLYE